MTLRAHVCLSLSDRHRDVCTRVLGQRGIEAVITRTLPELAPLLSECAHLLLGRPPQIDYAKAPRLALLQIAGAGVDPLFPAQNLRPEVHVANCRGVHADGVRDHVFAALLSFARNLPRAAEQQAARHWKSFALEPLTGKHLVLLGYGAIGSRIGETARSFGLRVSAVCRTARAIAGVERVATASDMGSLLSDADFFVVAAPLTHETRGLVSGAALACLPPKAIVINVSRGALLDEAALETALRQGRLAGAALDVFETEPLPAESTLWTCPRLLLTPHVAGFEPAYLEKVFEEFAENVLRVARGEAPSSVVSREAGY